LYGPSAFQQLIPVLYQNALDTAEAFLSPTQYDCVVDLYCGIGVSLKRWSFQGARVLGVELAGEAVECARHNVPQALLLRGKCSERIPQLNEWIKQETHPSHQRLLYVNPPRTGIEPQVIQWVIDEFRPRRIAYLSCSAGTLRRDLDRLVNGGYQVAQIRPYDFFPQTYHVEALVLLTLGATQSAGIRPPATLTLASYI
jgi:tRNA/tmRNA/rRNA uracil-C5-methylase (TrmA/RlmC/RlmD family)